MTRVLACLAAASLALPSAYGAEPPPARKAPKTKARAPARPLEHRREPGGTPTGAPPPSTTIPEGLTQKPEVQPWYIRAIVVPMPFGMFIRLPIIDTDPNRGLTYGFMPIWVVNRDGRIKHIHAPSVTYNRLFKIIPTYRYYYYPTKESSLILRGSISEITDRELMGDFEDLDFLGRDLLVGLRVQYNIDGSRRFFGVGPDTPRTDESNYTENVLMYRVRFGAALPRYGEWHVNVSHYLAGEKISGGPIDAIPDITTAFPSFASAKRRQNSAFRLYLTYDTRDYAVTTTRGTYTEAYAETSQRSLASQDIYQRYGIDLRHFHAHPGRRRFVSAGRVKFEQVVGTAPFWLLTDMGGKYTHRAYGDGRYVDKGILTTAFEERVTVHEVTMSGVTTEFEVAPFAGIGTVFDTPGRMARRYFRPVFGGAVRAVARPQVVGSIDFGVGQEGLTAFMDINYSF